MPLVKDIVLYAVVERVCRIVAAMVKAGVPLPDTLAAAIQGTNNKVFEAALHRSRRSACSKAKVSRQPITDTGLFPKAATQMMRVGEDTGTLDTQLDNAAQYYGRELEYKLKKLTSLFEPAVIIFMGAIVGFVAVALDLGDVRHLQPDEDRCKPEVTSATLRGSADARMIRRPIQDVALPAVQTTVTGAADPERARGYIEC